LQTSKGGKPLKAKKATPTEDFDPAGTSTKVNVHTDKSVDMHTNVVLLSYEKNWRYPKGRHRRVIESASHSA
jgi:hypothetical protein